MSRRYALKVADMKKLAEQCRSECHQLTAEWLKQREEATERMRGGAVKEALGRLEILDDCRRIVELQNEIHLHKERIVQRVPGMHDLLGHTDGTYRYGHVDRTVELTDTVQHGKVSSWAWQAVGGEVRRQAEDVIAERYSGGTEDGDYRAPDAGRLLETFKECSTAAEVFTVYCREIDKARAVSGHTGPDSEMTAAMRVLQHPVAR